MEFKFLISSIYKYHQGINIKEIKYNLFLWVTIYHTGESPVHQRSIPNAQSFLGTQLILMVEVMNGDASFFWVNLSQHFTSTLS